MLEEIRAQYAATIDAVHASGRELRDEIVRAKLEALERRVAALESARA